MEPDPVDRLVLKVSYIKRISHKTKIGFFYSFEPIRTDAPGDILKLKEVLFDMDIVPIILERVTSLDSSNLRHRLFGESNKDIGGVSPYFIRELPLRFSQQRGARGNVLHFSGPHYDGKFREAIIKVGRDQFDDLGEYREFDLIVIYVAKKFKTNRGGGESLVVETKEDEETKADDGSIMSAISTDEGSRTPKGSGRRAVNTLVPTKLKVNMCDLTKEKDDAAGRYELETTGVLCSFLYDISIFVDLVSLFYF